MLTFIFTAILEIAGCYYFAQKNYLLSIPLLIAFAWSLTLQPYEPAKTYVIYGGIYIIASAVFAYMTGVVLNYKDIAGILLLLTGVLIML